MSQNNRKRWIVPWKDSTTKPAIYNCLSRIVGRGFVLESHEREHFRMLMRMCEKFTGCRVLSYCVMSNHFHVLLEVPPMPKGGISNEELLRRLGAFYKEAKVAEIAAELEIAASVHQRNELELPPVDEAGVLLTLAQEQATEEQLALHRVEEIRSRYTRRMHDLSEFMKSLLERFTKWFNRTHSRSGTLWEDRFKSLIVESGVAARTIAAYIDLNPVRAGMVSDPAEYRWSSYGEAIGGGRKGNGRKAREGLVRAMLSHEGTGFEVEKWGEMSSRYRRLLGMALERKPQKADVRAEARSPRTKNTAEAQENGDDNDTVLKNLGVAGMLRRRVRYFTDGAVIGSRAFVNEAFTNARDRFSRKRKDGARKLKGVASPVSAVLWSLRDLRKDVAPVH